MGQRGRWRGEVGGVEGMWKGRGRYTTMGATRNVVIFEKMGGDICKLRQVIFLSSVLTDCSSGVVFRVVQLQGLMNPVAEQKIKERNGVNLDIRPTRCVVKCGGSGEARCSVPLDEETQ